MLYPDEENGKQELPLPGKIATPGKVYRVVGSGGEVHKTASAKSPVLIQVPAGALVLVLDTPGQYRQVFTADRTFGYLSPDVKLERIRAKPDKVFDLEAQEVSQSIARQDAARAVSRREGGLSRSQVILAVLFGIFVFGSVITVLIALGRR
jgi:hypothetical protein